MASVPEGDFAFHEQRRDTDHESFLVHALTREGAAGLAGSEMDRRVSRMEGRG